MQLRNELILAISFCFLYLADYVHSTVANAFRVATAWIYHTKCVTEKQFTPQTQHVFFPRDPHGRLVRIAGFQVLPQPIIRRCTSGKGLHLAKANLAQSEWDAGKESLCV